MEKPTLIIMAAGMGSRFGGLKQITPVGDRGEIIMDFSVYDARQAGFEKVIFVIKRENEADFRAVAGAHAEKSMEVRYAFQELTDLPEGFAVPEGRVKPWGTGHAVRACRALVDGPFAVINADDFYGPGAFRALYGFLSADGPENEHAMVAYRLRNTVTENGYVSRGVCQAENGYLTSITERTRESMMGAFDRRFAAFLRDTVPGNPLKAEYYLPGVADAEMTENGARVRLLPCEETWYGVTYREDLPTVRAAVARMKAEGVYPPCLWEA